VFHWVEITRPEVEDFVAKLYALPRPDYDSFVNSDPQFIEDERRTLASLDSTREMRTYRSKLQYFANSEEIHAQLTLANEVFNKYFI